MLTTAPRWLKMFTIISALANIGVSKEVDIFYQDAKIGKLSIDFQNFQPISLPGCTASHDKRACSLNYVLT